MNRQLLLTRSLATKSNGLGAKRTVKEVDADALITSLFGSLSMKRSTAHSKIEQPALNVTGNGLLKGEITPQSMILERIINIFSKFAILPSIDIEPPADAKIPRLTNGLDRVLFK